MIDQPLVDIVAGKDSDADRNEDTNNVHGLGACTHLLALLGQKTQAAANKRRDQQFGRDDGRSESVHQGLDGREGRDGTIADGVGQWAETDHTKELQSIILEGQRQGSESLVVLHEAIDEFR